jgi:hypothetical protein
MEIYHLLFSWYPSSTLGWRMQSNLFCPCFMSTEWQSLGQTYYLLDTYLFFTHNFFAFTSLERKGKGKRGGCHGPCPMFLNCESKALQNESMLYAFPFNARSKDYSSKRAKKRISTKMKFRYWDSNPGMPRERRL